MILRFVLIIFILISKHQALNVRMSGNMDTDFRFHPVCCLKSGSKDHVSFYILFIYQPKSVSKVIIFTESVPKSFIHMKKVMFYFVG